MFPVAMLQQHVTTTQPSPAGMFISQSAGILNSSIQSSLIISGLNIAGSSGGGRGDISPISSTGSFSSADTNQTLLNAIINHQQQNPQLQQQSLPATPISNSRANNRSFRTKYSQFMIITPAVSIDREFQHETVTTTANGAHNVGGRGTNKHHLIGKNGICATTIATTTTVVVTAVVTPTATATTTAATNLATTTLNADIPPEQQQQQNSTTAKSAIEPEIDDMSSYFNNGNIFRMSLLQGSIDSGCSSDSGSFRSSYNPYLHTSRSHLLPKTAPQNFYTFSSWRWCTLICAAMRCFGGSHSTPATYSNSFVRPPYQRTRSHGHVMTSSVKHTTPHQRLRPSSSFTAETAFEHFSAPFTPRKTRDHMNNITYEL